MPTLPSGKHHRHCGGLPARFPLRTGRTFGRVLDACDSVEGSATPAVLELSDFDSVVACAESVRAMDTPIDMLICNAGLFSLELAARLEGTAATSNSLHPGVIRVTNIMRNLPAAMGSVRSMPGKNIPEGAATNCYVATYPELVGVSGLYFDDCNAVSPGGYMEDRDMAQRLWEVSAELTRDYLG